MNQIPQFFNPSKLQITSARQFEKDGHVQEMVVQDPEGDKLTVTQWTQDVGMLAVMPRKELKFQFTNGSSGESVAVSPSKDELVGLSYGLSDAEDAIRDDGFGMPTVSGGDPNPIDSFVAGMLVSEVADQAGIIRGF